MHRRKSATNGSSAKPTRAIHRVEDCIGSMQNGTDIIKVKSRRDYRRRYFLNDDASFVYWEPTSKSKDDARINITSIKEVRRGQNTESFVANGNKYDEARSFSLIYGEDYKSLDLVAASDEEANVWILGLGYVLDENFGSRSTEMKQQMRDRWLTKTFQDADKDDSGTLDEGELIALAQQLNIGLPTNKIKEKFKEYDTDHGDDSKGKLDMNEFSSLFKELSTRPEIYHLLMRYSTSREFLRPKELKAFLETEQEEKNVSIEECEKLIATYEPSPEGRENFMLSVDGFNQFLLGVESSILDHHHRPVFQDMSQPLSHYFIASSHNTYLMEDQLKGPSSVEMYIRALRKGCRCVELDCWDGDEEPEIYHGYTLTSHILFKDVIAAVKEHAFATSDYPVILSLENHCSISMQRKMAEHLKTILGDMLWVPEDVNVDFLPSPESLKGKVLIKGKKLKPETEAVTNDDENDDGGDVTDEDEAAEVKNEDATQQKNEEKRKQSTSTPPKTIKLAKTLSRLVTNHAVHFVSFEKSATTGKPYHMSSFGESKTLKLVSSSGHHFINYNKRQLSRIYPAGSRITSSNYNPQTAWNAGCQIVALNYQTPGEPMDINDGRFQINGKSGYVLKPEVFRSEISVVNVNSKASIPGVTPCLLKLKIISGQAFPKPDGSGPKGEIIDPYVVIDIHGIPHDNYHKKTKTIDDNGFNPVWDESFRFLLKFPDVAMVRFTVFDEDTLGDDFIGQFSLSFTSLATGYRHIPLLSKSGERLAGSTVFVHVGKEPAYSLKKNTLTRLLSFGRKSQTGKPQKLYCESLDKLFQGVTDDSLESSSLRRNFEKSVEKFKRLVGCSSSASMAHAVSLFASKMKAKSIDFRFTKQANELTMTHKVQEGDVVPETTLRVMQAFEEVLRAMENLAKKSDEIVKKLMDAYEAGAKKYPTLNEELSRAELKGKKLERARDSFALNMQMIKGQADQLSLSKDSALYEMHQIIDAATSAGVEIKFDF